MPSPFPGMNPFLERAAAWHDFHERFLILGAGVIGAQVRPNFIVRIDEHIFVHELPDEPRRFVGRADLGEAYLEIRDRKSREVVTVLELLSPSNKRAGRDRDQYLAKRQVVLASQANLVEIDLLRGGDPMPGEDRPACCYSAMVSRAGERPEAGFWPIGLRDPLLTIPIPLKDPYLAAALDLQALLHRVYDEAGYEYDIYDGPPEPPLSPEDDAWARDLIPAAR